jgi:hypothetical protein
MKDKMNALGTVSKNNNASYCAEAYKALRRVANNELIFCNSSFYDGDYNEYCFVGCD